MGNNFNVNVSKIERNRNEIQNSIADLTDGRLDVAEKRLGNWEIGHQNIFILKHKEGW